MDAKLVDQLDEVSEEKGLSRAALIREACGSYLRGLDTAAKERAYDEGYRRIPETTEIGEAQLRLLAGVLPKEAW